MNTSTHWTCVLALLTGITGAASAQQTVNRTSRRSAPTQARTPSEHVVRSGRAVPRDQPAPSDHAVPSDNEVLQKLVTQIRQARQQYQHSMDEARAQMQAEQGRMSHVMTAQVLLHKEQLDALETRLLSHCAMMEIRVPDTSLPVPTDSASPDKSQAGARRRAAIQRSRDDQARVRLLLRASWRREAHILVQQLRLPILILKPQ